MTTIDIEQLQAELTRARDFHYPAWWGADERVAHNERIAYLSAALDAAIEEEREARFWQELEDEQFNSSVWEDWEGKLEAEIQRDQTLNQIESEAYWRIDFEY